MGQVVPTLVEQYLHGLNRSEDPVLAEIRRAGAERGLPLVGAEVGALLRILATAVGARRILEIGTASGYSSIWLAGALPPDGMLLTMEADAIRAQEARANIARAGLSDRISVIVGPAERMLHKIAGPFDLVFQDADKQFYNPMLERLVDLLRPGGLLVTDNALWGGEVVPGYVASPRRPAGDTAALVEYNQRISAHPKLMTAILPMRDGLAVSVKSE